MPPPEFFQTGMGHAFYEGHVPMIALSLKKIADELCRANNLHEQAQQQPQATHAPAPAPARSDTHPPSATAPLSDIQQLVALSYETGKFFDVKTLDEADGKCDSLFSAIMGELSPSEDCYGMAEALRRLSVMREQIEQVTAVIEQSDGKMPAWDRVVAHFGLDTTQEISAKSKTEHMLAYLRAIHS